MLEYLDKLPTKAAAHWLWGDYIELHCLKAQDKTVSVSDIYDSINENRDSNVDAEEYQDGSPAEHDDALMQRICERFQYLGARSALFKEHYPFTIAPDSTQLSLKGVITESGVRRG